MENELELELYHHGIKGQRWGIRRFQNYNGTYTKKGLARYQKSVDAYNKAKAHDNDIKEANKKIKRIRTDNPEVQDVLNDLRSSGKNARYESKSELKSAKRQMNRDYKQLKRDYVADQGKELYRSGQTITGNQYKRIAAYGAASVGNYAAYTLAKNGKIAPAAYATIALGGNIAALMYEVKTYNDDRKLRAYYAH